MYLIEILLPVRDNEGLPFAMTYQSLGDELTEHYGGVTVFTRAPAEGETEAGSGKVHDNHRIRGHEGPDRSPLVEAMPRGPRENI